MDIYIGGHLRELKQEKGFKEQDMADAFCVSQSTINKYINNVSPVPFDVVENILKRNKELGKEVAIAWKDQFEKIFINALTA